MKTKQDKPQGGQCSMQDGVGRQHPTEITSRNAKARESPELMRNPLGTGIAVFIMIYDSREFRTLNENLEP